MTVLLLLHSANTHFVRMGGEMKGKFTPVGQQEDYMKPSVASNTVSHELDGDE